MISSSISEEQDSQCWPPEAESYSEPCPVLDAAAFALADYCTREIQDKPNDKPNKPRGRRVATAATIDRAAFVSGKKLFVCPELDCLKVFKRQEHLSRHSRMHSGERPFKCTGCERSFSRSDNLAAHFNRAHREARRAMAFDPNSQLPSPAATPSPQNQIDNVSFNHASPIYSSVDDISSNYEPVQSSSTIMEYDPYAPSSQYAPNQEYALIYSPAESIQPSPAYTYESRPSIRLDWSASTTDSVSYY